MSRQNRPFFPLPTALAVAVATLGMLLAGPALAAPIPSGTEVSFQSVNYPTHYIRHQNSRGKTTDIVSQLDSADSTFILVAGLADKSAYSLQSAQFPGSYLRHRNGEVWLDPLSTGGTYAADATFRLVAGLAGGATISFQSVNYPGSYLRHANGLLYLAAPDSSATFTQDATFNPHILLQKAPQSATSADSHNKGSVLLPNQYLTTGDYLVSSNKWVHAVLQGDGNFVEYVGTDPSDPLHHEFVWNTGKTGPGGQFVAVMQSDGNFCVYQGTNANFHGAWVGCAGAANGSTYAALQDDGNFVMYRGLPPSTSFAWNSGRTVSLAAVLRKFTDSTKLVTGAKVVIQTTQATWQCVDNRHSGSFAWVRDFAQNDWSFLGNRVWGDVQISDVLTVEVLKTDCWSSVVKLKSSRGQYVSAGSRPQMVTPEKAGEFLLSDAHKDGFGQLQQYSNDGKCDHPETKYYASAGYAGSGAGDQDKCEIRDGTGTVLVQHPYDAGSTNAAYFNFYTLP